MRRITTMGGYIEKGAQALHRDLGKLIELWPYQISTNGYTSPSEMTGEYLRSLGLSREAQKFTDGQTNYRICTSLTVQYILYRHGIIVGL